ncbi:hypothetical protein BVX98_00570 [bacterium F11]|nr:hypothetical protein BVX98_00570 [bacterium F11]
MKNISKYQRILWVFVILSGFPVLTWGGILIDTSDQEFFSMVQKEINSMREGKRGVVCQKLIEDLDVSLSTTIVRPLTRDDRTWHPNDHRGKRSHVVADDFLVRGAARVEQTKATFYLHPTRINSRLSSFKLGTFVHQLVHARDLNYGEFSGDYRVREKRASFFRNAWRDSLGLPILEMAGEIGINEYSYAKERGLLTEENKYFFPILDVPEEEEAVIEKEEVIEEEEEVEP